MTGSVCVSFKTLIKAKAFAKNVARSGFTGDNTTLYFTLPFARWTFLLWWVNGRQKQSSTTSKYASMTFFSYPDDKGLEASDGIFFHSQDSKVTLPHSQAALPLNFEALSTVLSFRIWPTSSYTCCHCCGQKHFRSSFSVCGHIFDLHTAPYEGITWERSPFWTFLQSIRQVGRHLLCLTVKYDAGTSEMLNVWLSTGRPLDRAAVFISSASSPCVTLS